MIAGKPGDFLAQRRVVADFYFAVHADPTRELVRGSGVFVVNRR
jgi:hypothetical protein